MVHYALGSTARKIVDTAALPIASHVGPGRCKPLPYKASAFSRPFEKKCSRDIYIVILLLYFPFERIRRRIVIGAMNKENLVKYRGHVLRKDREYRSGHKSAVFLFTGLSASGKSTIAHGVEEKLFQKGMQVFVFDGDNVRHGLCSDLSFSRGARAENLRRIAEVSKLFVENGTICLCAFISPLKSDRALFRGIVGERDFHEIFVSCSVETCEERDGKGFYKLAREGKIKNFTGISAPYEIPENPELVIETDKQGIEASVEETIRYILKAVENSI